MVGFASKIQAYSMTANVIGETSRSDMDRERARLWRSIESRTIPVGVDEGYVESSQLSLEKGRGKKIRVDLTAQEIGHYDLALDSECCRGQYNIINRTLVVIDLNGEIRVGPASKRLVELVQRSGFTKGDIYVPFSNSDFPVDQEKFKKLQTLAKRTRPRVLAFDPNETRIPNEKPSGASTDRTLFAEMTLPHGLEQPPAVIGHLRDLVARDLLNLVVAAQSYSDRLSVSREPSAQRELDRLVKWLYARHQQAQQFMNELGIASKEIPPERLPIPHPWGKVAASPLWTDGDGKPPLASLSAPDALLHELREACRRDGSEQARVIAEELLMRWQNGAELHRNWWLRSFWSESELPDTARIDRAIVSTVRNQDGLTLNDAKEMCNLIMRHQRSPGDPEIQERGCVIATCTPDLLKHSLECQNQVITCSTGENNLGVSLFNPPESCPPWLTRAVDHYPDTRNGTLTLILVAPEYQGRRVFKMLMNATMCSLAATGATHIVGWVEHTNKRAITAYERLGGEVSDECTYESTAPNGETTTFKAFRMPIRGLQE